MSEKKVGQVETNNAINLPDNLWKRYQKPIISALAGLVVLAGGWYLYKQYVVKPKEEKAQAAIWKAEEYYRMDSLKPALNGDGANKGFLYIIKTYPGTKTANLAKFYAGICYLKMDDADNAIKYLKDFDTDSKLIQMIAWGRLADAYSVKNQTDKAIEFYKKASRHFPDDADNASEFLFRAAALTEAKDPKAAVKLYKELKEKFPGTEKGFTVDKYIYRLSIEPNQFTIK